MIAEDQYAIWMNDSTAEEMDETEVNWKLYCREMSFDHPSKAE